MEGIKGLHEKRHVGSESQRVNRHLSVRCVRDAAPAETEGVGAESSAICTMHFRLEPALRQEFWSRVTEFQDQRASGNKKNLLTPAADKSGTKLPAGAAMYISGLR